MSLDCCVLLSGEFLGFELSKRNLKQPWSDNFQCVHFTLDIDTVFDQKKKDIDTVFLFYSKAMEKGLVTSDIDILIVLVPFTKGCTQGC